MKNQTIIVRALLTCALCAGVARAAGGDINVAGGGVVPVPAEGYAWEKVREVKGTNAPTVQIFSATKEGSQSRVVLIVEQTPADTDAKKLARIKRDYNGMASSLQEQGYTGLKGAKPPLAPPFGDRVWFSMAGKDKDGKAAAFHAVLLFGKCVYHVQAAAGTEAEAKALARVADAVKE
jgi:hypothetical protein